MRQHRNRWPLPLHGWLAFVLFACGARAAPAAPPADMPGMSWESIKALPDFSGPWNLIGSADNPRAPNPPDLPLLPAVQKIAGAAAAAEHDGVDPATIGLETIFCRPPRFSGFNKNDNTDYFEILFTPGRVTVTNELGLIRRIRLTGETLPADPEETNTGTSYGHWEGGTLVVETEGLKRDTFLLRNPALKLGWHAHVTERISLPEAGVLEVQATITAPELLTAPWQATVRYKRYPAHQVREVESCTQQDRSYDHEAEREKFDLTPPPDLPPPPPARKAK